MSKGLDPKLTQGLVYNIWYLFFKAIISLNHAITALHTVFTETIPVHMLPSAWLPWMKGWFEEVRS